MQLTSIFIECEQQLMRQLGKINLGSMLKLMTDCQLERTE